MKSFYLIPLALAAALFFKVSAFADLNLSLLNPSPAKIGGVDFPRKDVILYRGTQEGHFSPAQAIFAMLNDERQNLESAMFRTIREILSGKSPILFSKIVGLKEEYNQLGVQQLIDSKKAEQKGNLNEDQAIIATKEIMDSLYTAAFARSRVFDYASTLQDIFPKAFVYSTLHVEVAKIYSPHIVLFQEKKPRSLDVNFWNRVNNGKWVGTNRSYPDRGEFVSAFYIPYDSILGYQYARRNFTTEWQTWRPMTSDLGYVYMKQTIDGTNYVLVLDGTGLQHIVLDHEQFCSATTQFEPEAEIPKYPVVDCNVRPKIVGVFRRCAQVIADDTHCSFPAKLFSPYETSAVDFTSWVNSIKTQTFKNGDYLVYSNVSVESKDSIQSEFPTNKKKKKQ